MKWAHVFHLWNTTTWFFAHISVQVILDTFFPEQGSAELSLSSKLLDFFGCQAREGQIWCSELHSVLETFFSGEFMLRFSLDWRNPVHKTMWWFASYDQYLQTCGSLQLFAVDGVPRTQWEAVQYSATLWANEMKVRIISTSMTSSGFSSVDLGFVCSEHWHSSKFWYYSDSVPKTINLCLFIL
jgi:hypothetical protein